MSDRPEKHIECYNCGNIELQEWDRLYKQLIMKPRPNDISWICERCGLVIQSQNPKNRLYIDRPYDVPYYIRNGNSTAYKLK